MLKTKSILELREDTDGLNRLFESAGEVFRQEDPRGTQSYFLSCQQAGKKPSSNY